MSAAPVRGTQSFVGVMAAVWRRPSLTLLEVLWRWLPAILLCGAAWGGGVLLGHSGIDVQPSVPPMTGVDLAAIQNMSAFQPVAAVHTVSTAWHDIISGMGPLLLWLLPAVFVLWNVVAAIGRTWVLRRLDGTLRPRRSALFLLGTLSSALLLVAWWLWGQLVIFSARTAILNPAERGRETSVVLFAAMLIVGTLTLYVLWAAFSWFLQLAPLLAMRRNVGAFRAIFAALGSSRVSGKLIEINLVMNIVRIGLLVLAMVFCATPLPFSSNTSATFLHYWWSGVGLAYLAMSDYFHVVRAASYLSLYGVLENPA
ncbi:hypothetical protein GOB94_06240 [Granulicella sp. 5B5]|uniref:hypothetical protein n=1 Tax=Granulicella sp. 5B5 TaxID=1617967 RepID=UPI0015F42851|nr:hypothetical protein [Granulicella sp. 5B5]QMV18331.1 hypothetical protein GOB94_06240 [Granulicella sp. 5B5]